MEMMSLEDTLDLAVNAVKLAGLMANRGYPGTAMAEIDEPVVAVNVEKVTREETTLAARVCAPGFLGGTACEDGAWQVIQAWTAAGGTCRQESCTYDGESDLFCVEVLGTWTAPVAMRVTLAGNELKYVTAIQAQQTTQWNRRGFMGEEPVATAESLGWTVTLEEHLPSGDDMEEAPEPFALVIFDGNRRDCYENCVWTSIRQENRADGIWLVRTCHTWEERS